MSSETRNKYDDKLKGDNVLFENKEGARGTKKRNKWFK